MDLKKEIVNNRIKVCGLRLNYPYGFSLVVIQVDMRIKIDYN